MRKELHGNIRLVTEEENFMEDKKVEEVREFDSVELPNEMKNLLKVLEISTEEELILNLMVLTSIMTAKQFEGSYVGTIAGEMNGTSFIFAVGNGAKSLIELSEGFRKFKEEFNKMSSEKPSNKSDRSPIITDEDDEIKTPI